MSASPAPSPEGGGERVLGLVTDPGTPAALVRRIAPRLGEQLAARLGDGSAWRVETVVESLPVGPQGGMLQERPVRELADRHGWDTVVAVVDLPRFEEGRGVVADVIPALGLAVVCVPALGVTRPVRRLRETLLRVVEHLQTTPALDPEDVELDVGHPEGGPDPLPLEDQDEADALTGLAPMRGTDAGRERIRRGGDRADVAASTVFVKPPLGTLRLLAGMVMANRPLTLLKNMTWSIASASAAGAYGVFFGSIWTLSSVMSLWRLAVVMVLSILLLVVWLITTNGLWALDRSRPSRSVLDNVSTVLTVGIASTAVYGLLFGTLALVAFVIIPAEYLAMQLGEPADAGDYLRLVWLAASMGTMAGAVGSSFDDTERIRTATYSLREQERRAGGAHARECDADGGR